MSNKLLIVRDKVLTPKVIIHTKRKRKKIEEKVKVLFYDFIKKFSILMI